jgi:hypothetical protein
MSTRPRQQAAAEQLRNESRLAPSNTILEPQSNLHEAEQRAGLSRDGGDLALEMETFDDSTSSAVVEEAAAKRAGQGWTLRTLFGLGLVLAVLLVCTWYSVTRDYEHEQSSQAAQPALTRLRPQRVHIVLTFEGPFPVNLHVKCGNSELALERVETHSSCGGFVQAYSEMGVLREALILDLPAGDYQVAVSAAASATKSKRRDSDVTKFIATVALDDDLTSNRGTEEHTIARGQSQEIFSFVVSIR